MRLQSELQPLRGLIPSANFPVLERRLEFCPDPVTALRYLKALQERHPEHFLRMAEERALLNYMVLLFSHSRFLAEAVVARPEWIEELLHSEEMERVLTTEEMVERLNRFLAERGEEQPSPLSLVLFRKKQLLRIVLRDILELGSFTELTTEVSSLADSILEVSYQRLRRKLIAKYGVPQADDEGLTKEAGFVIMALGKLGGEELNYSSDIDLMFLYSDNGSTSGERSISNKEFFVKLSNQITTLLSSYTAEGFCYRVDLRLRPDGSMGELCMSLPGALDYYRCRARDWELQMLIKARQAAGETNLGIKLLTSVEPLIYSTTLDFRAVEAVSEARARRGEKLAQKGDSGINIKLTDGGIRDIEFLVQCLQRLYGGRKSKIRHGSTLEALSRVRDSGFLSDSDYTRLVTAYSFLRHLEHRLQFWQDQQTHTLPTDPDELEVLARRMRQGEMDGRATAGQLLRRLDQHRNEVKDIYERVIHQQRPMYYSNLPVPEPAAIEEAPETRSLDELRSSNLAKILEQRAPNVWALTMRGVLSRGWPQFENFIEEVAERPDCLNLLDSNERLASNVLDIFEHSPYFSEQLIRKPELIMALEDLTGPGDPAGHYLKEAILLDSVPGIRQYWRREMLRIQARSICLCRPIFATLKETSNLTDAIIAAAYRMAIEQVRESHLPVKPGYEPFNQMMVIALGRLGMLEFDLSSDADLVFVVPDEDLEELPFWTKVVEKMIQILTAYSGDGVMFAVDTRLRPNGGDGPLVQTAAAYKDYFGSAAQAWEGITYMKSRAIAGNPEAAGAFLKELQEIDWRRHGQSGTSAKQLRQMRMRLEKETGSGNILKSGRGGYYDVDFVLMFLRLKSAGIFFDVLNTPERIDIIEKMGHLDRVDAQFLRDAATFYRAVDHALRVYSGHSEGQLPKSEEQMKAVTQLVSRWTPQHLHDQALDVELRQIQDRTRRYFERLFA